MSKPVVAAKAPAKVTALSPKEKETFRQVQQLLNSGDPQGQAWGLVKDLPEGVRSFMRSKLAPLGKLDRWESSKAAYQRAASATGQPPAGQSGPEEEAILGKSISGSRQIADLQKEYDNEATRRSDLFNRTNQYGPNGSIEYGIDDQGRTTVSNKLNSQQQRVYDTETGLDAQGNEYGQLLMRALAEKEPYNLDKFQYAKPSDIINNRQRIEDELYRRQSTKINEQFQRDEERLNSQLAARGIAPGSELYNKLTQDLYRERGGQLDDAYASALDRGALEEQQRLASLQAYNDVVSNQANQYRTGYQDMLNMAGASGNMLNTYRAPELMNVPGVEAYRQDVTAPTLSLVGQELGARQAADKNQLEWWNTISNSANQAENRRAQAEMQTQQLGAQLYGADKAETVPSTGKLQDEARAQSQNLWSQLNFNPINQGSINQASNKAAGSYSSKTARPLGFGSQMSQMSSLGRRNSVFKG